MVHSGVSYDWMMMINCAKVLSGFCLSTISLEISSMEKRVFVIGMRKGE